MTLRTSVFAVVAALAVPFSVVSFSGCGVQEANTLADDGADEAVDSAESLATEVKATAGGMTVWLSTTPTARTDGGQARWIFTGRTSRDVTEMLAWVPDDALGHADLTGARTFELSFDTKSEANTMLSGLPLFLDFNTSAGKLTARLDFAPRFVSITGSSKLSVTAPVLPEAIHGGLTYRGLAKTSSTGAQLSVTGLHTSARATAGEWNVDGSFDELSKLLGSTVTFTGTETSGTVRTKKATLTFTVAAIGLTTFDPITVWPSLTCTPAVQSCLNSAPITQDDFSACGSYRDVMACGLPNQLPVLRPSPDDNHQLDDALASVKQGLPVGQTVAYTSFVVDAIHTPSTELAVRAWLDQNALPVTANVGARSASQVNASLDGFGARPMVPAAQHTVLQTSYQGWEVDGQRTSHGATEKLTWVFLHFPSAARLVVIQLGQK